MTNKSTSQDKIVLRIESTEQAESDMAEYAYVIRDLRRVALLAGMMFSLLIALSFLLH
jgi:hypothetical protein